jgi:hypothetical protein
MRFLIVSVCPTRPNQHRVWRACKTRSTSEREVRKMNREFRESNPTCSSMYFVVLGYEVKGDYVWGDELRSRGYFF